MVALLLMILGLAMLAGAQDERVGQASGQLLPRVSVPVTPNSFDGDLWTLPKDQGWTEGMPRTPEPIADLVRQPDAGDEHIPASIVNFAGIGATGSLRPDVSGGVGPNHYVQMVNAVFAIYNESGALLAGPSAINTL